MINYRLVSVRVSRLRGFTDSTLDISRSITYLVGPNNSGKTSILRLLNWVLAAPDEKIRGEIPLSKEDLELLEPANSKAKRGRRITLEVEVRHKGSQRKYGCDKNGVVPLRIGITSDRARINLGEPRHHEESDSQAFELLERLRSQTVFTLIEASRDAQSPAFVAALREASFARIAERALHSKPAGAYSEYRNTKKAIDELNKIAQTLLAPLWDDIKAVIPDGIARRADIKPEVDPEALVEWLSDKTTMKLSTGDHDETGVMPSQVGAGLQSLLELAINRAGGASPDIDWIIGLEEPEAFLHPSAQRAFARSLRTDDARLVVSTHSPIVVDEAEFPDLVLVRNHRFYRPRSSSANRDSVNSALLSGPGSEMLFADSVLLVEGVGDRCFFEELRRRIAESGTSEADRLWVVSVGGKDFSAWIKLLRSYGDESDRPIAWGVVADDDALRDVRDAYAGAGATLSADFRADMLEAADVYAQSGRTVDFKTKVKALNAASDGENRGPIFLAGELEEGMISEISDETAKTIAERIGPSCPEGKADLLAHLKSDKAKWKRTVVAREIPWEEVSENVFMTLERWLDPALVGSDAAARLAALKDPLA